MDTVQLNNVLRVVAEQQHGHLVANVFVGALCPPPSPQKLGRKADARLLVHGSSHGREFTSAIIKELKNISN